MLTKNSEFRIAPSPLTVQAAAPIGGEPTTTFNGFQKAKEGFDERCGTVRGLHRDLPPLGNEPLARGGDRQLVVLAPVYVLFFGADLLSATPSDMITQAVVQGVVTAIVALYFFGEAVRRLGASRPAVLGSLTPVIAALLGVALLGEHPTRLTWAAIIVVSVGVVLASGGFSRAATELAGGHAASRK